MKFGIPFNCKSRMVISGVNRLMLTLTVRPSVRCVLNTHNPMTSQLSHAPNCNCNCKCSFLKCLYCINSFYIKNTINYGYFRIDAQKVLHSYESQIYCCIIYESSILIWHKYIESHLNEDIDSALLHSQNKITYLTCLLMITTLVIINNEWAKIRKYLSTVSLHISCS